MVWRRILAGLVIAGGMFLTVTQLGTGQPPKSARSDSGPAFRWLIPASPPTDWGRISLPSGNAVLAYPPQFHPIRSDPGTVSVAVLDKAGHYLAYLNATPRQGSEQLATWPTFRIDHQRDEGVTSIHERAQASNLEFRAGRGSCTIDEYVTLVGHNSYREVACLVVGASSSSVVVAAAPPNQWSSIGPTLLRALAAYQVR
ncbi:MAG: hypothetical protein ACRD0I_11860 [Acidimicrobiales bacterium]